MNLHKNTHNSPKERHKELLGMDLPKNYFKSSKSKIMEKISIPEKEKSRVFYLRPAFRYAIAASVILLLALGIYLNYNNLNPNGNNTQPVEFLASAGDQDVLINSLFVSEDHMDAFLDTYLISSVLEKAELEEQEFDNLFLNSVIENDSLIDLYIDENLIDNIIL